MIQSESQDMSTYQVLQWIQHNNELKNICIFLDDVDVDSLTIKMSNKENTSFMINGADWNMNKWYRRGLLSFAPYYNYLSDSHIIPVKEFVNSYQGTHQINKFSDNYLLKLDALFHCIHLNIAIPDSLITDNLTELKSFVKKHQSVIMKTVKNAVHSPQIAGYKISL